MQHWQYHGNEQWYEKQQIYSHWNPGVALTIVTCGFPEKYKAITLSRMNSIINNFFSECNRTKCFCKLVDNKANCHWNKSVSCQTSGLQMITTWSWLQYISATLHMAICRFVCISNKNIVIGINLSAVRRAVYKWKQPEVGCNAYQPPCIWMSIPLSGQIIK